jgi:hypothetical protein
MEGVAPLLVVTALAFLCESLTEYFFADALVAVGIAGKHLRYIAAVVGVTLALLYGLDAMHQSLGLSPRLPHVGEVLTGLVLGRGSNYVHDLYARYIQPEAGAKA